MKKIHRVQSVSQTEQECLIAGHYNEILVYPAYEKLQKAGIKNICIHKGPADGKIKNMIFGENSAAPYGIDPKTYGQDMT